MFSIYGDNAIDALAGATAKAGAHLTTDTFIKAMDTMSFESDTFGSAPSIFTPTKHVGSDAARLSQLRDGRSKVVADDIKPN